MNRLKLLIFQGDFKSTQLFFPAQAEPSWSTLIFELKPGCNFFDLHSLSLTNLLLYQKISSFNKHVIFNPEKTKNKAKKVTILIKMQKYGKKSLSVKKKPYFRFSS